MIRDASRTLKLKIACVRLEQDFSLAPATARSAGFKATNQQHASRAVADTPEPSRTDPNHEATFGEDLAGELIGLRSYAVWLCRSNSLADDLIQETLLNAWSARNRFQRGTNLRAWCITILRNNFFSHQRRSWRSVPLNEEHEAGLTVEHDDLFHRLDLLALRNAIALLPVHQREAILLIGAGGASYHEAAEICACAIGTVKSRVSRGRLRLSVLIQENKAGFNSDRGAGVEDALGDLLRQVSCLRQSREKTNVIQKRLEAKAKVRALQCAFVKPD